MARKAPNPDKRAHPPEEPADTSGVNSSSLAPAPRDEPAAPLVPSDPLGRYLSELRKYPRLTREEERDLSIRYKEKGDKEAGRILATSNLRLVVRIAMDYRRSYLNLLDLIQEGSIGLLQAISKYDPYRGVPFSAYAGYWIRAYILKYLLDHWSLVRVGTTNARRRLFYNLRREQARLEREGLPAGPKLLAQSMGTEEEDVVEVSRALKGRDISIDQPVRAGGDSGERYIWETMASGAAGPEEAVARDEMQAILKEKIAEFGRGLKKKDLFILEKRLLAEDPLTLQAIGDRFGTTREAVRQAETRLVQRLRDFLKSEIKDLKSFEIGGD